LVQQRSQKRFQPASAAGLTRLDEQRSRCDATSALAAAASLSRCQDCALKGSDLRWFTPPANATALSSRLRLFWYQLEFVCHSAKLRQGADAHLPHQIAAMDLHCDFWDTDIVGNLLAEAALHDLDHYLAFPSGERCEARPERTQGLFILAPSTIASEAEVDRVDQVLITERLDQELNGTALSTFHCRNKPSACQTA
jgi:hypothetical protein